MYNVYAYKYSVKVYTRVIHLNERARHQKHGYIYWKCCSSLRITAWIWWWCWRSYWLFARSDDAAVCNSICNELIQAIFNKHTNETSLSLHTRIIYLPHVFLFYLCFIQSIEHEPSFVYWTILEESNSSQRKSLKNLFLRHNVWLLFQHKNGEIAEFRPKTVSNFGIFTRRGDERG